VIAVRELYQNERSDFQPTAVILRLYFFPLFIRKIEQEQIVVKAVVLLNSSRNTFIYGYSGGNKPCTDNFIIWDDFCMISFADRSSRNAENMDRLDVANVLVCRCLIFMFLIYQHENIDTVRMAEQNLAHEVTMFSFAENHIR